VYSCGFFLSSGQTEKVLLVLYSGDNVGRIPYRVEATCDQPLCGREQFTVASITPASVPAGANVTVTLQGTALHTRDTVQLAGANQPTITATVRSVLPDRTTLTATLDLRLAPAGVRDLVVQSHAGETIRRPGAFTIHAGNTT
jgi:hypothetical protein